MCGCGWEDERTTGHISLSFIDLVRTICLFCSHFDLCFCYSETRESIVPAADHHHKTSEKYTQLPFLEWEISLTVWEWLPLRVIAAREMGRSLMLHSDGLSENQLRTGELSNLKLNQTKNTPDQTKKFKCGEAFHFFKFCPILPEIIRFHYIKMIFCKCIFFPFLVGKLNLLPSSIWVSIQKWFKSFHFYLQFS